MKYRKVAKSVAVEPKHFSTDFQVEFASWLFTKTSIAVDSHIGALAARWLGF